MHNSNHVVDQFAALTYSIFDTNGSKKIKILSIASSINGEGSSTVATNSALHLATSRNGQTRILLVDANLRRPSLHNFFQVPKANGLADLLLGELDFNAAVKKTPARNLFLISSGREISDPTQILTRANLHQRLVQPAQDFDYVLLDCPPVNLYPETTALASESDGIVLVVWAGRIQREVAQHAYAQILSAKANVLGVVLNRRKDYIPNVVGRWLGTI